MNPSPRASSPVQPDRPLSVAELSHRIVQLLEGSIGEVWVAGEVSGVRTPRSGHCYFVLKDADAALNAVCFRGTLARAGVRPTDGMKLEARGRVTAYTPRSEYQIVVRSMRETGLGELLRRLNELKEKLRKQGLFAAELKQPIPRLPRAIGLVTSPTGAALRDMLNVLGRRARGLELIVSPAAVQGEAAPAEIVRAIERLQRHGRAEAIIVGRGGGSIEDLWAFNDERVVRAIAACPIPIVSAVGHETDTTLADYAADLRAPTPSAAAELVSAHYGELAQRLALWRGRLARDAGHRIETQRARLERCRTSWGLRDPIQRLARTMQRVDELREQLERAAARDRQQRRELLRGLTERLKRSAPAARWRPRLDRDRLVIDHLRGQLAASMRERQRWRASRLGHLAERLKAANPGAILQRGYSIVTHGRADRVVLDPARLKTGEVVRVRSARGDWKAGVLPPGDDLFENRS